MTTEALAPELIDLHDIVLVEPVSYLPETVGWVVVGLLGCVGSMWFAARRVRAWRADAYRRRALAEFAHLEALFEVPATRGVALESLAPLVKRTALAFLPREDVASLSGEPWWQLLDETGGSDAFVDGCGRLLEELAFCDGVRRAAVSEEEARALYAAVGDWIRGHRRPAVEG